MQIKLENFTVLQISDKILHTVGDLNFTSNHLTVSLFAVNTKL